MLEVVEYKWYLLFLHIVEEIGKFQSNIFFVKFRYFCSLETLFPLNQIEGYSQSHIGPHDWVLWGP